MFNIPNFFKYLNAFIRAFFKQIFAKNGVAKVEAENKYKKLNIALKSKAQEDDGPKHKKGKKFSWRFFRTGPATPRRQKACLNCDEPMWVSIGQIAFWHRACRTQGRNRSGYYKPTLRKA